MMDGNSSTASNSTMSTHQPQRYLDVMTTRPSHGKSISTNSTHSLLLVEPVLIPNLSHVNIEPPNEAKQSCLFYPTGEKNTNLRKEIEHVVLKHNQLLQESQIANMRKVKNKYRVFKEDKYANAKGPPLFYTKASDDSTEALIRSMAMGNDKISSTVRVRLWSFLWSCRSCRSCILFVFFLLVDRFLFTVDLLPAFHNWRCTEGYDQNFIGVDMTWIRASELNQPGLLNGPYILCNKERWYIFIKCIYNI